MKDRPALPAAHVRPHEITIHGHTRVDDYFWLREKGDPEVIEYLDAENEYAQSMTAHLEGVRKKLYDEMVGRMQETDSTAPVKLGEFYYYSRTEKGKQYSIHCRKAGSVEADEEILLDLNILAEGHDYLRLGVFRISPDQRLLAYSLDTDGAEDYTIQFKDLSTGELLPDRIKGTAYSAVWAEDNETLFYTTRDEAKRSYRLFRHKLGTDPLKDTLIHQEDDQLFRVMISKTRDRRYLILTISSLETSESHILETDSPKRSFRVVHPRRKGLRYSLHHRQGTFYVLTNDEATNFKVMTVKTSAPEKENWLEYIPHRENVLVERLALFENHMVVHERENGLQTLRILDFSNVESSYVPFPEPVYTVSGASNPEFGSGVYRFVYSSLTTSNSVIDYNMETSEWTLVKQKPVLGGYDPANYETERIFAPAEDGTEVPVSLVYRKGFARDGSSPLLLYGYGSYGSSMDPGFNSSRLSLLDRGFVFAIAHVRGGQEMGRQWYEDGKFLKKKNTFTDFVACARHLIDEGYTSRERLAIMGRSAGGLLIGAVLNLAPELFKVAVAGVPFVDVVTTMMDESIPLTVGEFEEWGNPRDEKYYDYMLSYSPYDNVEAREYPHLLVTAGLNDPRVAYWEPAKWTAKLRRLKTDDNVLLLKTFMGAGHFSSSGRYDYLKDLVFEFAFIMDMLGIEE
jgi:oligopeptidase B